MGPDFICIGAQRAGTTWLHNTLSKHPQLWLTPIKELHHFDDPRRTRYFKHLINRLRSTKLFLTKWDFNYFLSTKNDDRWYSNLFNDAQKKGLIAGEITPAYATLSESDFQRIKQINPDIRIIFLMRNPIDRSWSAFMNAKRKNKAGNNDLNLTEWGIRYCLKESVLSKSRYIDTINTIEKVFSKDKIFYGFYDDIVEKPELLIESLLKFLNVNVQLAGTIITKERVNGVANGMEISPTFVQAITPLVLPSMVKLKERFSAYSSIWIKKATSSINSEH